MLPGCFGCCCKQEQERLNNLDEKRGAHLTIAMMIVSQSLSRRPWPGLKSNMRTLFRCRRPSPDTAFSIYDDLRAYRKTLETVTCSRSPFHALCFSSLARDIFRSLRACLVPPCSVDGVDDMARSTARGTEANQPKTHERSTLRTEPSAGEVAVA